MNPLAEPCEPLKWDTDFFGFPIARVRSDTLTPDLIAAINDWGIRHQIHCLYFLARPDDPVTSRLAEAHNFQLMDVRLTFAQAIERVASQPANDCPEELTIRSAAGEDNAALQAIARHTYRDTRFYFDSKFPRHLCEALYARWIKLSCEGYADAVWVAELDHGPIGYIACHVDRDTCAGKIGLIGVANEAQGRGVGQALVKHSLRWFQSLGLSQISVVTQGRNVAAQRLYQREGFLTAFVQLWYHKWFV